MSGSGGQNRIHRRDVITAILGAQVAAIAGCSRSTPPPSGELLSPDFQIGHRIRDGFRPEPESKDIRVDTVIVGGGMSGLSAAWRLAREDSQDFVVLEMDSVPGGTARSQSDGAFAYPWGAHYVPTPMRESQALVALLDEMGTLDGTAEDGTPLVAEQYLCREPEERVFYEGQWQEGLYPETDASDEDRRQLTQFREEVDRWVDRRDASGRRMFAIPTAAGSDDPEVMALDQQSMADWMRTHGLDSPRLRWLVDYCCRDDYGLNLGQTSAWAGLFYFAARMRQAGAPSQSVITWPEGNGRFVNHLSGACQDRLRTGQAVTEIRPGDDQTTARVVAWDTQSERAIGYRARRVVFAAPQFLANRLIGDRRPAVPEFRYGAWMVANVHLSDRPAESGIQMAWDNVIYGSKSLGYVNATHQQGIDHGPTVLTWYYPLTDINPKLSRQQLMSLTWSDWSDLTMTDLAVAHPDIGSLVTRLDVMRWGHAMIQPRVGFISSQARRDAARPLGRIHFAGTDLSGVALMEEAFYHGVRAAEEALRFDRPQTESVL